MLRLGPLVLSALLLGIPRALQGRAFGEPTFRIDVVPADPDLHAFGDA